MDDTIVALSSAASPAGRIIVRISGGLTGSLLKILTAQEFFPSLGTGEGQGGGLGRGEHAANAEPPPQPSPGVPEEGVAFARRLEISLNSAGSLHFPAWIYHFITPKSYTGQDLAELHIPGNPLLARMLLNHLLANGARPAEPGEFTARAYFNGKLDLAQAEGIAAAIAAGNQRELAAARRLMAGELARRLRPIMDQISQALALVEVGIDFSEEDVRFLSAESAVKRIENISRELQSLVAQSPRFSQLSHEPTIVLAGRPNAGKSTLLNTMAGQQRAIVSPIAGTTRDALSAEIRLSRGIVRMIDVAGLDEESADDEISKQMRDRAERAIQQADHVLLLRDITDFRPDPNLARAPDLVVFTKSDLSPQRPDLFAISAQSGLNIPELLCRLDTLAFGETAAGDSLALTARHLAAIEESLAALHRAAAVVDNEELLAAELRASLDALGQILGIVTPDDILGRIFAGFCIGK